MSDWEKHIEKLHKLDDGTKMKIMWIGVPLVMALVVWIWFSFSNFGVKSSPAVVESQEGSKFEVFKNGLQTTFEEAKKLINGIKEKIIQTNSFNIEGSKEVGGVVNMADTEKIFKEIASTTINN